jgi:type IV secretory pathway VirB2 component (pilin)
MQKHHKYPATLFLLYALTCACRAGFEETVGGVNNVLYGVAAGIALLLITLHAVKWKTAENPTDREEAKKGMINVVIGLIVIMIAATLVTMLFSKPDNSSACSTYDGWYENNVGAVCIGSKICAEGVNKEYREYTGAEEACSFTSGQVSTRCKTGLQDCPAGTVCSNGGCV